MARKGGAGRLARLDVLLVDRGLAQSRQEAAALIGAGRVWVDGLAATRSATQVRVEQQVRVREDGTAWVGRGALKLVGVLEPFGVDPADLVCADLGASTGGFTEVLLRMGARRVYAVDVGKGLLDWRLRTDPRVVNLEGVNARELVTLPEPIALLVGDLSFISLRLILPAVHRLLRPGGQAVVLVKPQFEAGRGALDGGGRVRSEALRSAAIDSVRHDAHGGGFVVLGSMDSPLPGARAGNVEHFLHLQRAEPAGDDHAGSAHSAASAMASQKP